MAVFKGRAKCIPKDRDAIFLPFQTAWIKDESRLKLMEKSRQIGISWSTAYGADERAAAQGAHQEDPREPADLSHGRRAGRTEGREASR